MRTVPVQTVKWLTDTKLTPAQRTLYMALVRSAGKRDRAWPSQEYLAKKSGITVRTVQRNIKALTADGWIAESRERINGRLRKVYLFLAHPAMPAAMRAKGQEI